MTVRKKTVFLFLFAGCLSWSAAAPIRVGIFSGVGQYLTHFATTSALSVLANILANPATGGLGDHPVIPPQGFVTAQFGGPQSNSLPPTPEQGTALVNALDTLDVVVFFNFEANGALSGNTFSASQKEKLETFFRAKGMVSIHAALEGSAMHWPQWNSLHGGLYKSAITDRWGIVRLDTAGKGEPSWRELNRGLRDTVRLFEEWYFFKEPGDSLRKVSGLRVSAHLDEASLEGGLGGQVAMGDHPLSWYRSFPEGGRLFYTSLGHRPSNHTGTGTGATPEGTAFLRRQVYNAIVWAAKRDSLGNPVAVVPSAREFGTETFTLRAREAKVIVDVHSAGVYSVEVRTLDGKRIAIRRGTGSERVVFSELAQGTVYVLKVTTAQGIRAGKVAL
jgi:type 1 glutamine amidotransferase